MNTEEMKKENIEKMKSKNDFTEEELVSLKHKLKDIMQDHIMDKRDNIIAEIIRRKLTDIDIIIDKAILAIYSNEK